ncbi:uncharacterized protein LOC129320338 isoform X1 [Prosopis cineraria]|nr:uncharacterized protein LOC129320338 isoform X1 [Prosopis cineraria]XP_054821721.1 uncharacterized protein LOC129320338 isoform X1 [Prosopis cineraria]
MDLLSDEKSSHSGEPGVGLPAPVLDITDDPLRLLNAHPTTAHHYQSVSRPIHLKRSRHYYGHQYSRRNSANHANASSSCGKNTLSYDERLSFKLASQSMSESKRHTEFKDKIFSRPERIRSSSLAADAASSDAVKMVCGVCQKPLKRKIFLHGPLSPSELYSSCDQSSIVAVLVCGHAYHAECLDQKTSFEERRDPPCPVCESTSAG